MRRLLALMGVIALMVAFTLPMTGTADAASHAKKDKMNPCAVKDQAKEKMNPCAAKNPCATKAANPCGKAANPCAEKKGMMDKAKDEGKKAMDKMKKDK